MLKSLCLINFLSVQGKLVLIMENLIDGTACIWQRKNESEINRTVASKESHKFNWYIIFIVLINTLL